MEMQFKVLFLLLLKGLNSVLDFYLLPTVNEWKRKVVGLVYTASVTKVVESTSYYNYYLPESLGHILKKKKKPAIVEKPSGGAHGIQGLKMRKREGSKFHKFS